MTSTGNLPHVQYIGVVRSPLKTLEDCPLQGSEGAPEAWIHIDPAFTAALEGLTPGSEVIVLTWFHKANRDVVQCYPRNNTQAPHVGVFTTRSPDRPNPIGMHPVQILDISNDGKIKVFPLEALDGTPVIDIKPVF